MFIAIYQYISGQEPIFIENKDLKVMPADGDRIILNKSIYFVSGKEYNLDTGANSLYLFLLKEHVEDTEIPKL
jgi:hypothetical protein